MKIATLALFVCSALFAQSTPESKPAVVEGKVLNSVTGEPLRKADVTLSTSNMPEGFEDMAAAAAQLGIEMPETGKPGAPKAVKKSYTVSTDAAGKFRLEHVDGGNYYLTAKHAGFVDYEYKPSDKDSNEEGMLHLTAGRELSQVEFKLVPHGALSGKVVDEDGDPVANAMVTAASYSYATGHRTLSPADAGAANDRGEFRLGKLPPGHYYLSAGLTPNPMEQAPEPPKDGSPEMGYVTTYFPRMIDVAQAESIELKPGADIPNFVIHLQKSRVVRVTGKLVNADGSPIKTAQVMLMSGGGAMTMRMAMVSNPEGKFTIANLQPGTYMAMVMQMGGASPSVTMQSLVVPNENLVDIKLGTQPTGAVHGRVTVSGDGKIPLKGLSLMLAADESAPMMPVMGKLEESGEFTLNKVSQAVYNLSFPAVPSGAYLKSVLWNGREMLGQPLNLTTGTGGDLQIILGTDGGQVDIGVTRDDKPVGGATVVLLPSNPDRRFAETVHHADTKDTGHATFKDVPPGDYLALAWEKVEQGMWFDAAFLKPFENQAVKITVDPKGNQKASLKPAVASR